MSDTAEGGLMASLRATARRTRLLAGLALLHFAALFLTTQPLSAALAGPLDLRPAAATLLAERDVGLLAELLMDQPGLIALLLRALAWALLLHGLLGWLLDGAILATRGAPADGRAFFAALAAHARRMVQVGLLGLLLHAAALGGGVLLWIALGPLRKAGGFAELAAAAALTALATLGLFALAGCVVDRARGLAVDDPALPATRAFGRALRALARRPLRWLTLALLPGLALLALALAATAAPFSTPFAAAILGVLLVLARLFVRLTALDWRQR